MRHIYSNEKAFIYLTNFFDTRHKTRHNARFNERHNARHNA